MTSMANSEVFKEKNYFGDGFINLCFTSDIGEMIPNLMNLFVSNGWFETPAGQAAL